MTAERYNPRDSEPRWQTAWDGAGIFATRNDPPSRQSASADTSAQLPAGRSLDAGPKYYVLECNLIRGGS